MASFSADVMVKPLMALLVARVIAFPSVSKSVFVMIGEEVLCAGMERVPADVCIDWVTPDPQSFWFAFKEIPRSMPVVVPSPGNT